MSKNTLHFQVFISVIKNFMKLVSSAYVKCIINIWWKCQVSSAIIRCSYDLTTKTDLKG